MSGAVLTFTKRKIETKPKATITLDKTKMQAVDNLLDLWQLDLNYFESACEITGMLLEKARREANDDEKGGA